MPQPVEKRVLELLHNASTTPFLPTHTTRETYLDLAEKIVRVAAAWQDEHGAIIDPVSGQEWGQSSPRFLSPAAILLRFGRLGDLREQIYRGMDWCCRRLSSGQAQSPDFWTRELLTAWMTLENQPVEAQRRARWKAQICSIDPEKIYWQVKRNDKKIEDLHNWTVYAAAGEALRQIAGLGPENDENIIWGAKFFQKYMPAQLAHFSPEGMYRDPNDPFTYDMTTRLQFATPLALGLETSLRPVLDDLLRRGALAQLLYVSPDGFSPFGGRSNQFHLQEAILAALGELEAQRYKTSNPKLAGAFKRQAHLSVAAIRRWLEMTLHRHLKNGFAPEKMHGCEDYALYSVYSLFTASCLALAAVFADESIEEAPMPAEIGGYVLELQPAFHKIFAVCGQTQIEIDTRADLNYDATGLGRFHRAGAPLELGVGGPFPAHPSYKIPEEWKSPVAVAIGPSWQDSTKNWVSLASLGENLTSQLTIENESAEKVEFSVHWQYFQTEIRENYQLFRGKLLYQVEVLIEGNPAKSVRLSVPLLESDGETYSQTTVEEGHAQVEYRGGLYSVRFAPTAKVSLQKAIANRNGIYRVLFIEQAGNEAELNLELSSSFRHASV